MRYLRVDEHSTRAELTEAIANLRARQRRVKVGTVRAELAEDIDELLDMILTLDRREAVESGI